MFHSMLLLFVQVDKMMTCVYWSYVGYSVGIKADMENIEFLEKANKSWIFCEFDSLTIPQGDNQTQTERDRCYHHHHRHYYCNGFYSLGSLSFSLSFQLTWIKRSHREWNVDGGGGWMLVEKYSLPRTHRNSGSFRMMMMMMNYEGLKTSRTKEKRWIKHKEIGLCLYLLELSHFCCLLYRKKSFFVPLDSFTCNFRKFNLFAAQRKDAVEGVLKTNYAHKLTFGAIKW